MTEQSFLWEHWDRIGQMCKRYSDGNESVADQALTCVAQAIADWTPAELPEPAGTVVWLTTLVRNTIKEVRRSHQVTVMVADLDATASNNERSRRGKRPNPKKPAAPVVPPRRDRRKEWLKTFDECLRQDDFVRKVCEEIPGALVSNVSVESGEAQLRRSIEALPDHTRRDRKFKKQARAALPEMLAKLPKLTSQPPSSIPIALQGESVGIVNLDAVRVGAAARLATTPGQPSLQIELAAHIIADKVRRGALDKFLAEQVEDQRFFLEQAARARKENGFHISQLIEWLEAQTDLSILQTDRGLHTLREVLAQSGNPAINDRALKWLERCARKGRRPRRPRKQLRDEPKARRLADILAEAIRQARQDAKRRTLTPQGWTDHVREQVVRKHLPDWSVDDQAKATEIACDTDPRPRELAAKIVRIVNPALPVRRILRGR
jgi:hypothetical protein